MDDSDDDTFVTIGTPLTPYEEDEVPKKPVQVQDQTVLDSKGRQRFHGAFTGGFSAGYFNTVGTKEGWTPSTFVSSRDKKEEASSSRRPEQFMDEEDFAEYGIAPKSVSTTDDFTSQESSRKRKALASAGVIPGDDFLLQDLVVPASLSMGVRLLRKLGWKEGQGIGPRVKRRAKRRQKKNEPEKKTYGCAMPPGSASDAEGSSEEDIYAEGLMFAPKDVNPISFDSKDNLHGLGYSGINPSTAFGHVNLFEPVGVSSKGKKGITGKAFGLGALEDEDDDIYALDHMSNYDRVLGGSDKNDTHGWTAPKARAGSSQLAIGYSGQVSLQGFKLAAKSLKPKKVFPPPQVPRNFRPRKTFKKPLEGGSAGNIQPTKAPERAKLDANTRGALLGEESLIKSVFDLVSVQDQTKLQTATQPPQASTSSVPAPEPKAPQLPGSSGVSFKLGKSSSVEEQRKPGVPLYQGVGSGGFKPFASDPAKQERYERYLHQKKHGNRDLPEDASHLTEWEREREVEEFTRAADLYRPLASMMATRFTSAKFTDDVNSVDVPAESGGDVSDQSKAAQMKMYGKLTRDVLEWHPDNTVCKRFNIPNPYPDSNIVGLPTVKRDKFSVFNFLNTPAPTQSEQRPPVEESTSKEKTTTLQSIADKRKQHSSVSTAKPGFKPLAILAEVDLSVKPPPKPASESEQEPPQEKGQTEEKKEETEEDRPPMDIFKAIFQSSDSESSSESEEERPPVNDPLRKTFSSAQGQMKVTEVDTERTSDVAMTTEETKTDTRSNGAATTTTISSTTIPVESLEDRLSAQTEVATDMAYGPSLPPPGSSVISTPSSSLPDLSAQSHKKQKHRHRDRDKHKHKKNKKKSKHKKHRSKSKHSKDKKKKKKKKRVETSSSSSGSDADSESSGDSDGGGAPSDAQILDKLRSLPTDKRPKAADFW